MQHLSRFYRTVFFFLLAIAFLFPMFHRASAAPTNITITVDSAQPISSNGNDHTVNSLKSALDIANSVPSVDKSNTKIDITVNSSEMISSQLYYSNLQNVTIHGQGNSLTTSDNTAITLLNCKNIAIEGLSFLQSSSTGTTYLLKLEGNTTDENAYSVQGCTFTSQGSTRSLDINGVTQGSFRNLTFNGPHGLNGTIQIAASDDLFFNDINMEYVTGTSGSLFLLQQRNNSTVKNTNISIANVKYPSVVTYKSVNLSIHTSYTEFTTLTTPIESYFARLVSTSLYLYTEEQIAAYGSNMWSKGYPVMDLKEGSFYVKVNPEITNTYANMNKLNIANAQSVLNNMSLSGTPANLSFEQMYAIYDSDRVTNPANISTGHTISTVYAMKSFNDKSAMIVVDAAYQNALFANQVPTSIENFDFQKIYTDATSQAGTNVAIPPEKNLWLTPVTVVYNPNDGSRGSAFITSSSDTTFTPGTQVTISAVAIPGYRISEWLSSDPTIHSTLTGNTSATVEITIPQTTELITITAIFTEDLYEVTLSSDPNSATIALEGAKQYKVGDPVNVSFVQVAEYRFSGWNDVNNALQGINMDLTKPTLSFLMPAQDVTLIAQFDFPDPPTDKKEVILTADPSGAVSEFQGADFYKKDDLVSVSFTKVDGYIFIKWIDENNVLLSDVDLSQPTVTFNMPDENVRLQAVFDSPKGVRSVSLTSDPAAAVTSFSGGGTYSPTNSVTVSFTGAPNYTFVNWIVVKGTLPPELSLTDPSLTFNMPDEDIELQAVFTADTPETATQYTLAYRASPVAAGTFTGTAAGKYDKDASVSVTARPASNRYFVYWRVEGATVADLGLTASDLNRATLSFKMLEKNVTLVAYFNAYSTYDPTPTYTNPNTTTGTTTYVPTIVPYQGLTNLAPSVAANPQPVESQVAANPKPDETAQVAANPKPLDNLTHSLVRVTSTNKVYAYSEPSYQSNQLFQFKQNDSLLVYGRVDTTATSGWLRIYWKGVTAYISRIDVILDPDQPTIGDAENPLFVSASKGYQIAVVSSDHSITASAGSGSKLGTVRKNTYAVVIAQEGTYLKIMYGKKTGYISASGATLVTIPEL